MRDAIPQSPDLFERNGGQRLLRDRADVRRRLPDNGEAQGYRIALFVVMPELLKPIFLI